MDASDTPASMDLNKGRIDGPKGFSFNLGKFGHLEVNIKIVDANGKFSADSVGCVC